MSRRRARMLVPVLAVLAAASAAVPVTAAPSPAASPASSAHQRAAALVARMTLNEKIAEVHGAGYPLPLNAAGYAGVVPGNNRLGIPPLYLADSPVGVGNGSTGVTQWPDTAALASSWDTALASAYGQAYGAEQFGKGHNVALAPTVNILRLPLWGRAPETYSEDPYLTAQQSTAVIAGVQSQHVVATVKHFVANNQEVLRSSINAVVSQRALQEIYQPAFQSAVTQAQVGAVMCSYNQVNGTYACQNAEELTGVLRDAWNFDGFVMSDWGALHSTVQAAKAGLDLEMPGVTSETNPNPIDQLFGSYFDSKLKAAVQGGSVSMATLDGMVTHILTAMIRIGLFDHPTPPPASVKDAVVSTPAHQNLATTIAEQGSVLLKNSPAILPLDPTVVHSIAVIGDAAQHPQTAAGGSATVIPSTPVVTPLAGITARAGGGVHVSYAQGTLGLAALPAVPASAFGAGLSASYYASGDLSGTPVATGTVANLDYSGPPAPVASLATWSARYTGTITAPATGDYRFTLTGGPNVTVWIDGRPLVTKAPFHEATANGLLRLAAGPHTIRVEVTALQATLVTVDQFAATPGVHLGWQPQENQLVAQAATAAKSADVAVVVVSDLATEGMDRTSLSLPADQEQLVKAVAASNRHTVVVLNTSSAVTMPWLDQVAGVLDIWYPGQNAGTALAAVMFGDATPSGKLPVTFPATDSQRPQQATAEYPGDGTNVYYDEGILVGYRWDDAAGQAPLFPFGYGLSYTSFTVDRLRVTPTTDGYTVTVTVTNTGARAGAEVVQLYIGSPPSANQPPRQLKGYVKVTLQPGQRQQVQLTVPTSALASWDNADTGWTVHAGTYNFAVGDSSRNLPLATTVKVKS